MIKNPTKTIIIIVVAILLIGLGVGGYLYLSNLKKTQIKTGNQVLNETGGMAEQITESATKGVLPSIQTNPFENKPDINPADKANPFTNVKTNPFE